MPELPEAETIARGLHSAIAGSRVEEVRVHRREVAEPSPAAFRRAMLRRRIESVGRRGKWIVAPLSSGSRWVTQLRMTGRFTWRDPSPLRPEPHLSLSLQIDGPNGTGVLRFYDVRRFGRTRILSPAGWSELDGRLGVEPLSRGFTSAVLAELLSRSRAPVKNVLLDQGRVAGIGNIYASEACWVARVDPRRPAFTLEREEVGRLHSAVRRVLRRAIRSRGTSFSDYRDVLGERGDFQNELAVYGFEGNPCPRCGRDIQRTVLAGRSTFYCERCQS